MDARSEASRTAGAVSVMTAEDVIDFTRILAQVRCDSVYIDMVACSSEF